MSSSNLGYVLGMVGVIVASVLGMIGVIRAATIGARAQHRVQDFQFRRQAYAACAAGLRARHDAAEALLQAARRPPPDFATRVEELAAGHPGLMERVGAVDVEGPPHVAHSAAHSAKALNLWVERLQQWAAEEDTAAMADDQWQYARRDQQTVELGIDDYNEACRKVLHPKDRRRPRPPRRGPVRRYRDWVNWRRLQARWAREAAAEAQRVRARRLPRPAQDGADRAVGDRPPVE